MLRSIYINSLIEKKKKEGREWKEEGKKGGRKEKNCQMWRIARKKSLIGDHQRYVEAEILTF